MMKIGLTGNIGSGKSVVAAIFHSLGVHVFQADTEAKKLFDDISTKEQIRSVFGKNVFSASGEVNRAALAGIVFKDKELLDALNRIIHPLVRNQYDDWCKLYEAEKYTLYEAAILFESGYYKELDKVICVTAPSALRITRVMNRDGVTEEDVKRRMSNQWEEERKVALSDYIIRNDSNLSVIEQVMSLHKVLVGS